MSLSLLVTHVLISLVPGILGFCLGGVLGFRVALSARAFLSTHPHWRRWGSLFPWRTLMLAALYFTEPLFIVRFFGLGEITQAISVGFTILIFAVPFTSILFLENWFPVSLRSRILGLARTLAAVSLILGARQVVGFSGAGLGIGELMYFAEARLRLDEVLGIWLALVGLVLVVDVLFGVLQLLLRKDFDKGRGTQGAVAA